MEQEAAEVPISALNMPTGQSVQVEAPASLHWPERQFEQSAALSWDATLNPSFDNDLPASQLSHEVEPGVSAYFPAPQIVQESAEVPILALKFPAGQSVQDAAPASLHLPCRQLEQSDSLLCCAISVPSSPMYLPLEQSEHSVAPDPPEYRPLPQIVQESSEVPALAVYFPGSQSVHAVEDSIEYCPGLHEVHANDSVPVSELVRCFPEEQAVQELENSPL
jgi:hypothetical protein